LPCRPFFIPRGSPTTAYRMIETFVSVFEMAASDLYHPACATFQTRRVKEVIEEVHERRAVSPQPWRAESAGGSSCHSRGPVVGCKRGLGTSARPRGRVG